MSTDLFFFECSLAAVITTVFHYSCFQWKTPTIDHLANTKLHTDKLMKQLVNKVKHLQVKQPSLHHNKSDFFSSEYKQLAHLILTIYFPLWSLTEIERVPRDTESEKPSHVTFQITKTREGLMCKYNMELFADETHQCGCEVCTVCLHRHRVAE